MFQRLKYVLLKSNLRLKLFIAGVLAILVMSGVVVTLKNQRPSVSKTDPKSNSSQQSNNPSTIEQQPDSTTPTKPTSPTDTKPTTTTPSKKITPNTPSTPSTPNTPSTSPAASCSNGVHTPGGSDGAGGCWPYAGNTGVPAGTSLATYSGPCSITSNTVIENKQVNCALQMYNNASLTVRRSIVSGFIENTYTTGAGKLLIEDSEVRAGAWSGGAIWGSELTVRRVEATGGQHSVHCESSCNVSDSWLHSQYNPDGGSYHNNAFISNGGTNMSITHNTLHCTAILNATDGGCTADLSLFGDFDTISYVTAESNLFMANNSSISYCAYGGYSPAKPYPNANNIIFRNNIFQRGPNSKCGVYGAVTSFQTTAPGNIWSNNKWSDGAILSP